MSRKEKKNNKPKYVDDGHTVYNMDGVGGARHREDDEDCGLTKKERRAAIRAAFRCYFPRFLIVIFSFSLVAVLLYLWLK